MKLLIDMKLSPVWTSALGTAGHETVHWSTIGAANAPDAEVLLWAKEQGRILLTHDLDFGAILAATRGESPSVLQIRTEDPTPRHCAELVLGVLRRHADDLLAGALVSIDESRARVRLLPLRGGEDQAQPVD